MTFMLKNKLKNLKEIIIDCIEIIEQNSGVIIVEGKRDAETLEFFKIPKDFIIIKSGFSLFDLVDQIKEKRYKQVIILFDFDREGKKLYLSLKRELLIHKDIDVNNRIRGDLYRLARSKGITEIEDIISIEV